MTETNKAAVEEQTSGGFMEYLGEEPHGVSLGLRVR